MVAVRRLLDVMGSVVLAATVSAQTDGLFSRSNLITLELKARLNELFDNARQDDEYIVGGELSQVDGSDRRIAVGTVRISLRGHTSKRESECSFPKLKLKFDDPPEDAAFADVSVLKIGTHCGEAEGEGLTQRFGRLPNEQSPFREAFVYRLLDVLGVPSLKARPARIAYVYADAHPGEWPDQTKPVVRNALLLEDDDAAIRRYGGDKEITPEAFTTAREQLTPDDTATLAFAEALIGNFDWCLRFTRNDNYRCDARRILWNILAVHTADRTVPLIYDFDVSGMVAGRHLWFRDIFNQEFVASRSQVEIEVTSQLQRARTLFPRALLDRTRQRFASKKADAYRALEAAPLDDSGRRRIQEYMDAFFAAMESDEAFYRSVVTAPDTVAYADVDRTEPACRARTTVPVGTPVGEPLETRGEMARVVLLDALWHWAPPVKCPAIQKGAVWISTAAIGKDWPR